MEYELEFSPDDLRIYLLSNGWNMVIVGRYAMYKHPFTNKNYKIMDAITITQQWIQLGATFNALPETD